MGKTVQRETRRAEVGGDAGAKMEKKWADLHTPPPSLEFCGRAQRQPNAAPEPPDLLPMAQSALFASGAARPRHALPHLRTSPRKLL